MFLNTKGTKGPERPNLKMVLDYFENKPIAEKSELVERMDEAVKTANKDKAWRREVMNLELKMYDNRKAGMQEGMQKGRQEEKRNVALKMLRKNHPVPVIAELTDLSEGEIKQLKEQLKDQ